MTLRSVRFFATILAFVFFAPSALADDPPYGTAPAVAEINGKFSAEGGYIDDDGAGIALASVTLPLSHSFGLQLDGAGGYRQKGDLFGGAGHLFYRDPARLLLGGYGSYHTWNSSDVWRFAGEAEIYLGQFSIEGMVGIEGVEGARQHEHVFTIADLVFYASDDLRFQAGHRYVSMAHIGVVGMEYLFGSIEGNSVSFFVDGRYGERDYEKITAGLRVYFGGGSDATLKYRHRNLDPRNRFPDLFSDDSPGGCPAPSVPFMGQCVIPE